MKVIKGSINLSKINKDLLIKGEKGVYLNFALLETPENDYGNSHMIVEDVPKGKRESGTKGEILGNAKTFDGGGGEKLSEKDKTDLPF